MKRPSHRVLVVLLLLVPAVLGCDGTAPDVTDVRLSQTAAIDCPGCPNLYRVNDRLYRGAQPTPEGFRRLEAMGIRTVVSLRAFHSDRADLGGTNLAYESIPMVAWEAEKEDLVRFLKIATDPERTPVFVHCQRGADRTGLVVAVYRVAVEGWTREAAIEEMRQGGYGFQPIWQNLVEYLQKLDVEDLRRQAGLTKS